MAAVVLVLVGCGALILGAVAAKNTTTGENVPVAQNKNLAGLLADLWRVWRSREWRALFF